MKTIDLTGRDNLKNMAKTAMSIRDSLMAEYPEAARKADELALEIDSVIAELESGYDYSGISETISFERKK